ncbi:MAG: hypothetical protein ABW020_09175, partial [Candidatus Rokuibacteriota bacterium]
MRRRLALAAAAALVAAAIAGYAAEPPRPPLLDAAAARALVAPYLDARTRGVVGDVTGEVQGEPRTPTGPPAAIPGAVVSLAPYAEVVVTALDAIKAASRDTAWTYTEGAGKLSALRAAYEAALAGAGAADLLRSQTSDGDGRVRFVDVPAGRWLLVAWHEVPHVVSGRKVPGVAATNFRENMERTGYVTVTYWRMDVEVRP